MSWVFFILRTCEALKSWWWTINKYRELSIILPQILPAKGNSEECICRNDKSSGHLITAFKLIYSKLLDSSLVLIKLPWLNMYSICHCDCMHSSTLWLAWGICGWVILRSRLLFVVRHYVLSITQVRRWKKTQDTKLRDKLENFVTLWSLVLILVKPDIEFNWLLDRRRALKLLRQYMSKLANYGLI